MDEKNLSLEKSKSKITLTTLIAWIRSHMYDNGMDTVFHVYNPDLNSKVYIIDDWGLAEDGKVSKWFQTLRTTGGCQWKSKFSPDMQLQLQQSWSGKSALASIMLEMLDTIEKELGYDASCAEVFCISI